MKVDVLREAGYEEALLGLSLSYNRPVEDMPSVAARLAAKGGSHAKFLESIAVWLDVTAPRYWWSQFDTYRIGVTKQSESTMHTLTNTELSASNFQGPISLDVLDALNRFTDMDDLKSAKANLPESFLQRRIICTNYKVISHIYNQRKAHRLEEWHTFCDTVIEQCEYPSFLEEAL